MTEKSPATEPQMTELSVSYSLGRKFDLKRYGGYQYENLDVHLSQTERYDVSGMSDEEIEEFREAVHDTLHDRVGALMEAEEDEMKES